MKRFTITSLLILLLLGVVNVQAQEASELPQNAEVGKCYAQCKTPDVYEDVSERILIKEASKKIVGIPAEYRNVVDTIWVEEPSKRIITIPAQYKTVTEQVMIKPATQKWVEGKADPNCLSADPRDCRVLCLVEVPAQYRTVTKRVVVEEARTEVVDVPGKYNIVRRKVLAKPARTEEIEIPAEYKEIETRKLVKVGGLTKWVEVVCDKDINRNLILEVQKALKDKGYDPGPLDGVMGAQTRAALKRFQEENNLPVGNMNKETMRALGIEE
ncbi:MAG: peptidoglycan-binding protein [Bernardetiaceae bacterium]